MMDAGDFGVARGCEGAACLVLGGAFISSTSIKFASASFSTGTVTDHGTATSTSEV